MLQLPTLLSISREVIDDATSRNAAVIDLQQQILSARQEHASLIERVCQLEKTIAAHDQWGVERQNRLISYSYARRALKTEKAYPSTGRLVPFDVPGMQNEN